MTAQSAKSFGKLSWFHLLLSGCIIYQLIDPTSTFVVYGLADIRPELFFNFIYLLN